jgi:hypothetical protein
VLASDKPGWQFIGKFESGDSQYLDMSSLKKEHGYIRVHTLMDYSKPNWSVTSKKIWSETDTGYIDCKQKRFAVLEATSYECRMAKCASKEHYHFPVDAAEFNPIPANSSQVGNVYSLVCQ